MSHHLINTAPAGVNSLTVTGLTSPLLAFGLPGVVTTNSVTAGATGGSGNYKFSWSAPAAITILHPDSNITTFSATLGYGASYTGVAILTVTDLATGNYGLFNLTLQLFAFNFNGLI